MTCTGYTDPTFKVRCPQPVTHEIRVWQNGWYPWHPMCAGHAGAVVAIMSRPDVACNWWAAEKRPLGERENRTCDVSSPPA